MKNVVKVYLKDVLSAAESPTLGKLCLARL